MTVDPSYIYSDRIRKVCDGLVSLCVDSQDAPFDFNSFAFLVNNSEIDWGTDGPALLLHMGANAATLLTLLAEEGSAEPHDLWDKIAAMKADEEWPEL